VQQAALILWSLLEFRSIAEMARICLGCFFQ
jgi:hypothetical protein